MVLEKAAVTAGMYVNVNLTTALGVSDRSISIKRDFYTERLRWSTTIYVVLWDTEHKRGWLVNGTRALLHFTRVSLDYSSQPMYL